jgi:hypothetical protein
MIGMERHFRLRDTRLSRIPVRVFGQINRPISQLLRRILPRRSQRRPPFCPARHGAGLQDLRETRGTSLSELTETWRLDGIGGLTGIPALVNGRVYIGDWHGVVHLLQRHLPVRVGQAYSLAAKRSGGLPAPEASERVSAGGVTHPE